MSDLPTLRALNRVQRNPKNLSEHTGEFDDEGEPIMRAVIEIISAGDVFQPADAQELGWLLEVGAARELAEFEMTLLAKGGALAPIG